MEYNDLDDLLKYYLRQERNKSIYLGDSSIYEDGRILEIFPEEEDKINGIEPIFVFGTVVYLYYKDKFLLLKQTKENRVVDTLVGLGGKVKSVINQILESEEKSNIRKILNSYQSSDLETEEDMKVAAAREVMEETSSYEKDKDGNYTHNIIKEGIRISSKRLLPIGISRIRIINSNKTECWLIYNYGYELSEKEFNFIEEKVDKENREGILKWMSLDEVLPNMSYSDRLVISNISNEVTVSEIRDNINNKNIVRFLIESIDNTYIGTLVNGSLIYKNCEESREVVNKIKGI